MARSRRILALIALLVAWSLLVGWYAARWGGVYARGRLPDAIREASADSARPEIELRAFVSPQLNHATPDFLPRYATHRGVLTGEAVDLRTTRLANDGLQLVLTDMDGFSGTSTTIDLLHGPGDEVLARVEVSSFYDAGPKDLRWEKPAGWINVSRREWASLSDEHPLFVKFHLEDTSNPYDSCVSGLVRVPQ